MRCPNTILVKLKDNTNGKVYGRLLPCGDWRHCQACRANRAAKVQREISKLAQALEFYGEGVRVALVTMTLAPDGDIRTRFGKQGRDRICEGWNRAKVAMRREIVKAGGKLLAIVRVY